jgi:hypothetical protein
MGHASINMTFDHYGHLFENVEADRADMAQHAGRKLNKINA